MSYHDYELWKNSKLLLQGEISPINPSHLFTPLNPIFLLLRPQSDQPSTQHMGGTVQTHKYNKRRRSPHPPLAWPHTRPWAQPPPNKKRAIQLLSCCRSPPPSLCCTSWMTQHEPKHQIWLAEAALTRLHVPQHGWRRHG